MRTRLVGSWSRTLAALLLTLSWVLAACSSGSGDLQDGSYAIEHGYDGNFNDPGTGDACTRDASTTCGFDQLGTKVCTCAGGVYLACPCFPPKDWKGALTAPYCDALTGTARILRGQTCSNLVGSTCMDRSNPDPATREGCSCMRVDTSAQWACGVPSVVGVPEDAVSCSGFGTGEMIYLKDAPCDIEWQQCIARDFVDGTTPRGCVCLGTKGSLRWSCGSTNKWFVPE